MAKRDLCPPGIWLGVLLGHAAVWWGLSGLWTREPLNAPNIQWVQAIAMDTPTRLGPATPGPARLSPSVPTQAKSTTMRSEPRPESLLAQSAPEALPAPDPQPAVRGQDARFSETQAAQAAASAPATTGRPSGAELTPPSQSASYLNNPPPPYPVMSKRLGEQGRVVVRVFIDEQGLPKEALLEVKSGYSRLDQAALEAVMSWRYVPAKRGGVPLAMWFNVPVTFDLKSKKE